MKPTLIWWGDLCSQLRGFTPVSPRAFMALVQSKEASRSKSIKTHTQTRIFFQLKENYTKEINMINTCSMRQIKLIFILSYLSRILCVLNPCLHHASCEHASLIASFIYFQENPYIKCNNYYCCHSLNNNWSRIHRRKVSTWGRNT